MIVSINVTAIAMPISQNTLYFSIDNGQIKYVHNTHTFRMTIDRILFLLSIFLLENYKLQYLKFAAGALLFTRVY